MRYPNMMTSRRATCVAATFWCKNVILSLLSIWKKNSIFLVALVFVALCIFISSITYNEIYRIVRHHQHQIHAQQQAVQSMNAEQNLKIQAKEHAANTFIYYICMVLCYLPAAVSALIRVTYEEHWNIRWHFAGAILFMNSAINPFLYFWRNRETSVIINSVLNALLIPICIAGNVLVLAAVWRNPSLRTPSIILQCSLAVSDLLVGLLALPLDIAVALTPLSQVSSDSRLSQARLVLTIQLCCVSLDTMTAISVDRYLALHYHMRYPNMMTSRRATCKTAILLVAVVFFALCLFISSITYNAIYRIVRHHQHQMHAQQQAVQSMNAEQNLKIQAKKRAANTFIYYICMVLCYFPVAVSSLIWVTYKEHWNIRWHFADTILFMNSAINPFLYCWRNREVREAVL
ncbi:unnamed protein product, partial [Porites lobata]